MRVKRGIKARRRRNKVLDRAEGYRGSGSRIFAVAKEKNDRGLVYAYRDRKAKKREFRKLWITRIAAAAKLNGTSYSKFMGALTQSPINLDRKILSDMAIHDPQSFSKIVQQVMPK
jgi:large subunit ribosomal protein L20